jgi:hypothetical protein
MATIAVVPSVSIWILAFAENSASTLFNCNITHIAVCFFCNYKQNADLLVERSEQSLGRIGFEFRVAGDAL